MPKNGLPLCKNAVLKFALSFSVPHSLQLKRFCLIPDLNHDRVEDQLQSETRVELWSLLLLTVSQIPAGCDKLSSSVQRLHLRRNYV